MTLMAKAYYLPPMINHADPLTSALNKIDNLDSLQQFITDQTEVEMAVHLDTENIGIVKVRLRYYSLQYDRMLSLGTMAQANNADIYLRCECKYIAQKALEMFHGLDKMIEEEQNETIDETIQRQITVEEELATR